MTESAPTKAAPSPGLRMLIDFGPLAVFFLVSNLGPGTPLMRSIFATGAFMVAMFFAMGLSWWKTRHISPMLWISGFFVLVFGALTILANDPFYIKIKPTVVYCLFCAALVYGLISKYPILQTLLGAAYPGLSDRGWRILTMNWAAFFFAAAIINEIAWRILSPGDDTSAWAAFKLWGMIPLTFLFAAGNIPLLLRHGLQTDSEIVDKALPPEG